MQIEDQPKRGRPSNYTTEVADAICERLAYGESLRAICADAGMPGRATVFRWIACHKEFRDQYLWARNIQADYIYDEIIDIADEVIDPRTVPHARLRINTRLRQLARMTPRKYC
jgi:Bacteriophage Sf6, terminase small subunit-like